VALDVLVVSTALSTIRVHLHASLADLEWTLNAYVLSLAVLLMTRAALGHRFGRRRRFTAALGLFTGGSAGCAARPALGRADAGVRLAGRAARGAGGGRGGGAAAGAGPARGGFPAAAAPEGAGDLRGGDWPGRGPRTAGRRRGRAGDLLAVDLLDQRPPRAGH